MAALGNKLSLEQLKAPPLVKAQNYCNVCKKCETEDVNFVMLQRIANFNKKKLISPTLSKHCKIFLLCYQNLLLIKIRKYMKGDN